jgi:DegV family protein with EDD domain
MKENEVVFTDTASAINQEEAEARGIGLIPMVINVKVKEDKKSTSSSKNPIKEYTDFTLPPKELYKLLDDERLEVTTAAPNIDEVYKAFKSSYDLGSRQFLFIALSSKNSSAYQNIKIAADSFHLDYPDSDFAIVDSRALGPAQAFKVGRGIELLGKYSIQETKEIIDNESNKNISLYCSGNSQTAKFVLHGGRVFGRDKLNASAAAFASRILTPLIIMDREDGHVLSEAVLGGEKRGIIEIVKRIYNESNTRKQQPEEFTVAYTRYEEIGQEVVHHISRRFDLTDNDISLIKSREAGSALGVHAGPGIAIIGARWK